MEFIFQISGHPKVGKKTMPGLSMLPKTLKNRYFRKGYQIGDARIRQFFKLPWKPFVLILVFFFFSAYLSEILLL